MREKAFIWNDDTEASRAGVATVKGFGRKIPPFADRLLRDTTLSE